MSEHNQDESGPADWDSYFASLSDRAESLYEDIGGFPCICQKPEVVHWCEGCQRRIGILEDALRATAVRAAAKARLR